MGEQRGGSTLEVLAQRLEALAETVETLKNENAGLRSKVATLEDSGTRRHGQADTSSPVLGRVERRTSGIEGAVSRRALLGKAGAAAVAVMAAGTLLHPRQAAATHYEQDLLTADEVRTHLLSANVDSSNAVVGNSSKTDAVGVYGIHTGPGHGVYGDGAGANYAGVFGRNPDGTGVWGHSATTGYSGVYGEHKGTVGYGIVGDGTGTGAGVLGRNPGGPGIEARDSVYGGKFSGSRAQLMLVPKGGTAGKPTTGAHARGEISMDSKANLYVCTHAGTPGTWRRVQTVAT
jgi:hypothetical protein